MIKGYRELDLVKHLHMLLVLASLIVLFFPLHILWSLSLIVSVLWAVVLWLKSKEFQNRNYLAYILIVFYLILVLSGLWAQDKDLFLNSIRMKIVLLGLPFCFLVWERWTPAQLAIFTKGLLIAILFSGIYVLVNYTIHRAEILDGLLKGQPIPVPFKDHIRYSILLCFCLILSLYQADRSRKSQRKQSFYKWFGVCISIFFYIQFLAVKTGILLSVITIFCFIAYKIFEKKIYLKGSAAFLALMITLLFIAQYVPTVKNKLSYFSWDMGKYKEKDFKNYSDGERIVSIMKGYEIAVQHPLLGVGEGNLVSHMESATNKLPHNQFIVVWAQNGIIGLMCFIAIFILSFWTSLKKKNWTAFTYTLVLFIANMLEPMLETQLGLTIFVLPLLILHSLELSEKI